VLLGVTVNILAAMEHLGFLRRLGRREPYAPPRWSLAIVMAMVLSLLGLGMAAYLVST
jgi:hypothetical protein